MIHRRERFVSAIPYKSAPSLPQIDSREDVEIKPLKANGAPLTFPLRRTPLFFGFSLQGLSLGRKGSPRSARAWDEAADGKRIFSGVRFAGEELVQSDQENVSHALTLGFARSGKASLREKTVIYVLKTPRCIKNPRFFDQPVQD